MICLWHRWSKWTNPLATDRGWMVQQRTCEKCGYVEQRIL